MKRKLSLKAKLKIKPSNLCSKHYLWSLALGNGAAEMSYLHTASRLTLRDRVRSSDNVKKFKSLTFPNLFLEGTVEVVQASDKDAS